MKARLALSLILALALVGCDPGAITLGKTYLEAALGTSEITEFGYQGSRMATYDTTVGERRWLNIQGYQTRQDGTCTLSLSIRDPQDGKTYDLGPSEGGAHAIFTSAAFPKNLLRSFSTSRAKSGTLVLSRYDTRARIVEGTFEFVAQNNAAFSKDPATPDSIRVMHGRFRLGYDITAYDFKRRSSD